MNIFFKRPLLCGCMAYLLSSIIGVFLPPTYKIITIALCVVTVFFSLGVWLFKKIGSYQALWSILASAMIAFSLLSSYFYFDVTAKSFEKYYDKDHTIEATVVSLNNRNANWAEYDIWVSSVNGEENEHLAILTCTYNCVLMPGDTFTAHVNAEGFDSSGASYNEKLQMQSDRIFIQYLSDEESSMVITGKAESSIDYFKKINEFFSDIFSNNLDENTAKMSSALLLGNSDHLDLTVKRDFTRAGVSHILALSGMHMSIIMGILMFVLKKSGVNHKIIGLLLSICALFYLMITGVQISAARSVIMLLIVYLSILLSGCPDSLTSLGVAGALLMILFPGSVFDAGYWMSFAATLGIIVYMPVFTEFLNKAPASIKNKKWLFKPMFAVLSTIMASVFAMIPLIIVMCIFIKQISLYTVISSAILAIPSSAAILFSLLFIVFYKIPIISTVIANLLHNLTEFMTDFCAAISDKEGIVVSLNYKFATLAAIVIGLALFISLAFKFKKALVSLVPFAVSVVLFLSCIIIYNVNDENNITAEYCNVSSKSDMIVVSNNREAIICDIGNGSAKSYFAALDAVYSSRTTEIRAIVLTKYYNAHQSIIPRVCSSNKVRELWLPKPANKDEYYHLWALSESAKELEIDVYIYENGEDMTIFDTANLNIYRQRISRSAVPVIAINLCGSEENLLYCSSGYNEVRSAPWNDNLIDAEYIIFGNVGPKIKKKYTLPENYDADLLMFADKTHAAYFNGDNIANVTYALIDENCKVIIDK